MKKIVTLALGLALMIMAVPATAEENVREENREYLLDLVGDSYDADAMIQAPSGEMVEGEEALDLILDRLDRFGVSLVDLDDIEKNPITGTPTAGDFFLIELAFGTCNQGGFGTGGHYNSAEASPAAYATGTPWGTAVTWDFIGDATTIGSSGFLLDFVTGSVYTFSSQVDYTGSSDFWCFSFFGLAFNLPYIQGVVA